MLASFLAFALLAQVPDLPVLGKLPSFRLVDQRSRAVTDRDLAGNVCVADFIFTTCKNECVVMTSRLAKVQRKVADVQGVRFVSFSVDPRHDTPVALRAFAKRHGADERNWAFLTAGSEAPVQAVARGLGIHAGNRQHGQSYVLIDPQGRVRGYYSQDARRLRDLEQDIRKLAR